MNLYFVRGSTVWLADEFYEEKTEVFIFGDIISYKYICECLQKAESAKSNIHLDLAWSNSNSMRAVILPASQLYKSPRLKIIERFVFWQSIPKMELVIYGNILGYRKLSSYFTYACEEYIDDPDGHLHVNDWWDNEIIKRSVALSIRGPLSKWNPQALLHWNNFVFEHNELTIPSTLKYSYNNPEPYIEMHASPETACFLSLSNWGDNI